MHEYNMLSNRCRELMALRALLSYAEARAEELDEPNLVKAIKAAAEEAEKEAKCNP